MNPRCVQWARAAALVCCSVLLLACGGGNDADGKVGMEGKYFYQMTGDQGMTLELQKTGIAIVTRPGGTVQQGTYQLAGETLTVTLEGAASRLVYTIEDDDNLATTFYGTERAVFVKQ